MNDNETEDKALKRFEIVCEAGYRIALFVTFMGVFIE